MHFRFMVPMHARKRKEALHEPTHPRPLPGGEQAFGRVLSVPLLGGVRGGFMVPMHARKRQRAFHGPGIILETRGRRRGSLLAPFRPWRNWSSLNSPPAFRN